MNERPGKVLYGLLFCAVLPGLLLAWTRATKDAVEWSAPDGVWPWAGWVMASMGFALLLVAMRDLWEYGKGLPMNAFPPKFLVQQGAYALFVHPIYVGAVIMVLGFALGTRSSSGLYLVSPVFTLCCWALVQGYERDAIRSRFGERTHQVLFSLPGDHSGPASLTKRMAVAVLVFAPWLFAYELLIHVGPAHDAIDTFLPCERGRTVLSWAEPFYALTYPFVFLVPFVITSSRLLRGFALDALWAMGLGLFLQAVLPFMAEPLTFIGGEDLLSKAIRTERASDGPAAAFPSFHVIWAFVATIAYARKWPGARAWLWITGMAISWSCLATGAHSLADVLAAILVCCAVARRTWIAEQVHGACERIANSWAEWHFGPVRIISHGLYAGLGGAVCIAVAAATGAAPWPILFITVCGVIAAALWGQFVEGSPRLLRPFGFYGSVLGVAIGAGIAHFAGVLPVGRSLVALALAAPWMQLVGRFRCLVQGCCHGYPVNGRGGIVYLNDHTRACAISNLKGVPIHNTQLYSMCSNMLMGMVLWRLAWSGMSHTLIIGLYLILSGIARFVEEHYRGEAQTMIAGGLRLYQWVALATVLFGMLVTCLPSTSFAPEPLLGLDTWIASALGGVIAAFAMGGDLPRSHMRFSRLSG
jgi:protein-S-isoprenylcysteine O-methyltransferase Ste14